MVDHFTGSKRDKKFNISENRLKWILQSGNTELKPIEMFENNKTIFFVEKK